MSDQSQSLSGEQRTPAPSKRSSMACTTCRQVKLRCDATRRFPAPCSRCERQGKACLFDPVFKRRPVRGALEKVIEERDELRRLVDVSSDDPSPQEKKTIPLDLANSSTSQSPRVYPVRSVGPDASVACYPPETRTETGTETGKEFELDRVQLDDVVVQELLNHFRCHYLYHLPIVDVQIPASSLLKNNSLLFWTIIIIAARDHPSHTTFAVQLHHPYKKLLSEHLSSSICCVYTIQALLLLCTWPFPVRYQRDDPSWGYCGLAVAATLQMRLHETGGSQSDTSTKGVGSSTLRLKTWLGCFFISTRLSADLGLPPPMASVAHMKARILRQLQDHLLGDFLYQLELQQYSVRAAAILSSSSSYALQTSLVELLEHDLGAVEDTMQRPLALTVEIDLLAAKLRLYALPLLSSQTHQITSREHASSRVAWYKGFHVAVHLANIFTDKSEGRDARSSTFSAANHDDECCEITSFHPKHYFCVLVMTGMYLLKLVAVDGEISTRDKTLARSRIKQVYATLMRWSQYERDEMDRAAKMIETISDHVEDRSLTPQETKQDIDTIPSIIDDGIETAWRIRRLKSSPSGDIDSTHSHDFSNSTISQTLAMDGTMSFSWDDFSEWNPWFGANDMLGLLQTSSDSFP